MPTLVSCFLLMGITQSLKILNLSASHPENSGSKRTRHPISTWPVEGQEGNECLRSGGMKGKEAAVCGGGSSYGSGGGLVVLLLLLGVNFFIAVL